MIPNYPQDITFNDGVTTERISQIYTEFAEANYTLFLTFIYNLGILTKECSKDLKKAILSTQALFMLLTFLGIIICFLFGRRFSKFYCSCFSIIFFIQLIAPYFLWKK